MSGPRNAAAPDRGAEGGEQIKRGGEISNTENIRHVNELMRERHCPYACAFSDDGVRCPWFCRPLRVRDYEVAE